MPSKACFNVSYGIPCPQEERRPEQTGSDQISGCDHLARHK